MLDGVIKEIWCWFYHLQSGIAGSTGETKINQ